MDCPDQVIDPRKLAAIHIATMGSPFVICNFAGTALVCLALGAFILWRADSCQQLTFGSYISALGINYLLMLFYAFEINSHESARAEIDDELTGKQGAMAEYRRQTIYLLLPLVVPIVAFQRRYKAKPSR